MQATANLLRTVAIFAALAAGAWMVFTLHALATSVGI